MVQGGEVGGSVGVEQALGSPGSGGHLRLWLLSLPQKSRPPWAFSKYQLSKCPRNPKHRNFWIIKETVRCLGIMGYLLLESSWN